MTTTETPHDELSAELPERIGNLSPAAKKSLGGLLEQDAAEEAQYTREHWTEIRRRLDAYDRGEEAAYDWRTMIAEIRGEMEAMREVRSYETSAV